MYLLLSLFVVVTKDSSGFDMRPKLMVLPSLGVIS